MPAPSSKSETSYRQLVESAADIIYTTDENGGFRLFNPTAQTILGYSRAELEGRRYLDIVRLDHRESVRRFYGRQYLKRIDGTYREFPAVAKNGSTVWLGQNVQIVWENGRPSGFQVVARDVTRRIEREQIARAQRLILEMIARGEALPTVLDQICRSAEGMEPGLRCSILLLEGNELRSASGPSMQAEYLSMVDRHKVCEEGGPCAQAVRSRNRVVVADFETDPRWTRYLDLFGRFGIRACWSVPVISSTGEVLATFAVYYDAPKGFEEKDFGLVDWSSDLAKVAIERHLAERRISRMHVELEDRVARRTRELEASNTRLRAEVEEHRRTQEQLFVARKLESVGRLAGGLAHEFNNWLTVILLYCEQLSEDGPAGSSEGVEGVRRAAQRAATLTRQLLAFGRKQVLNPRVVNLGTLANGVEEILRGLLGTRISVRFEIERGLWNTSVDPAQIEQVLVNLALNARDAMPNGGSFSLLVANVPMEDAATLGAPEGCELVMVEASDTGTGMTAEVRERVFEPFFTTKGPGKGTGLGLATVYGVIRQSGGQISLWSAPGQGTRFRVFLPRTIGAAPEETAPQRQMTRGEGERILVVEDDNTVRRLIVTILGRLHYRVAEASSADDALNEVLVGGMRPDLVLTDLSMPGIGGRELARQLSLCESRPRVLMMSGYNDSAAFDQGDAEWSDAYLPKPFTAQVLASKVREVLDGARAG